MKSREKVEALNKIEGWAWDKDKIKSWAWERKLSLREKVESKRGREKWFLSKRGRGRGHSDKDIFYSDTDIVLNELIINARAICKK